MLLDEIQIISGVATVGLDSALHRGSQALGVLGTNKL
jgi:hypothetical protein